MRPIREIQDEIIKKQKEIAELNKEIKQIQEKCPHPKNLLNVQYKETTDEYGRHDGSYNIYKCILCEHTWTKENE